MTLQQVHATSSAYGVDKQDVVLGVSASGRTPYTLAAIEQASEARRAHDRARLRSRLRAGALALTARSRSRSARR